MVYIKAEVMSTEVSFLQCSFFSW